MKSRDNFPSLWRRKDEGFLSAFAKLLFLILIYGLAVMLILDKTGRGIEWMVARFPILNGLREVPPIGLYMFWLFSLWLGFKIGKQVGSKRGAARERKRLGIPF